MRRPRRRPSHARPLDAPNMGAVIGFMAPSLIGVTIMFLIPTADVVRRSFLSSMGHSFVGLDNYATVLTNESFRLAMSNTGRFLITCIPLLLSLSLLMALLLNRVTWCRVLFMTSYLLPLAIPVTSVVLIIQSVFHANGLLSALCAATGNAPADWLNGKSAFWILVSCYLWKNLGYNVVLWMAGLAAIPQSLYEAARVDGAGEWRCFFHITMPLLAPTLAMTATLALVNSFKVFREAYLVAGQYPHNSIYMLQHVLSNWFANLDMQKISAAATLLMLAIVLAIVTIRRVYHGKVGTS